MNPGNTGVPDSLDAVAHRFSRQGCFLCDWNIARACCYNGDCANAFLSFVPLNSDEPRRLVPFRIRCNVTDIAKRSLIRARDEHVRSAFYESLDDADELRARFPC